jgi:hypothetical protein
MTSREYVAIEDLEGFFADLTEEPTSARYRGVDFSTTNVRPRRYDDRSKLGTHLQLEFSGPLSLDLHLETRESGEFDFPSASEPTAGTPYRRSVNSGLREKLHRVFRWSATNEDLVLELLQGRVGETLLNIARAHHIVMNDRGIQYGPIQGTPKEEATALDALVRVIADLVPPHALSGQCPACSTPVNPEATTCPSCGLSLT